MILILTDIHDETVDETINFLNHYNANYLRLNSDIFRRNKINLLNNESIVIDNKKIYHHF